MARCTVARSWETSAFSGARRGRTYKATTRSDKLQHRPSDLVESQFKAPAPNRLRGADLTYGKAPRVRCTPSVHHRRVLEDGRRVADLGLTAL